ncbi:MAG: DUF1571 domain-containing protein [Planctomycetaceae bacterium]|jgi:hypothetical protein|nr:DUF1571 domain-containing protein [Planctomycetaceae bacterium]
MKIKKIVSILSVAAVAAFLVLSVSANGLAQTVRPVNNGVNNGTERVASRRMEPVLEHPLVPVVRWAEKERPKIALIKDYSATLTKQECINGEVQEAQIMDVKVRHEPFSVYLKFVYPRSMAGQEAIYVAGKNDNKLVAHGVGIQKVVGTVFLDPKSMFAMKGNKYPITEMGVLNLVDKLLEVGRRDVKFGECTVNYSEQVKIDNRECTLIQVTHPIPRKNFIFNIARIFIDKELNIPIRYESFDWPKKEGAPVTLIEAYTYQKLRLNVGFTDEDFSHLNPAYDYK